jgi:hypothetical protein
MGKSHRDNMRARRKAKARGQKPFDKRKKRREGHYVGPWKVTFACGATEYYPHAWSGEIDGVARKKHECQLPSCQPTKFERLS